MNGDMCVNGRDSKCTHNFNWANERDRPLGKDVYEKITLKLILKKQEERVWTGLTAQDMDQCQTLFIILIYFEVP
jgi:hypothetical protein